MKAICVKELMIPLEEYATVDKDATIYDALLALEKAQENFNQSQYTHRAILVYEGDRIVGKIDMTDWIQGLEPGYAHIRNMQKEEFAYGGFKGFIRSMAEAHNLWEKPMNDICRKGANFKVKDIVKTPTEGEFVNQIGRAVV